MPLVIESLLDLLRLPEMLEVVESPGDGMTSYSVEEARLLLVAPNMLSTAVLGDCAPVDHVTGSEDAEGLIGIVGGGPVETSVGHNAVLCDSGVQERAATPRWPRAGGRGIPSGKSLEREGRVKLTRV